MSQSVRQAGRQAGELPFGLHLMDACHGELAETVRLLDLIAGFVDRRQGWLDLSLSFLVPLTALFGPQRTLDRGWTTPNRSATAGAECPSNNIATASRWNSSVNDRPNGFVF